MPVQLHTPKVNLAGLLLIAAVLALTGCMPRTTAEVQGRPAPTAAPGERMDGLQANGEVPTFLSVGRIDMPQVPVPPGAATRMTAVQQLQVAKGLLIPYLEQFKSPTMPAGVRIRDYRVNDNEINLVEGNFSPLTFGVRFSVLPEQPNSPAWLAGSGALQPDGWITDKRLMLTVAVRDGAYYIQAVDPVLVIH